MTAAIILNGSSFCRAVTEDYVICADGGANLVKKSKIDLIVGDMDSISDDYLGIDRVKVPVEKDFSDGELAIKIAKDTGFDKVAIYGANGGRIDHVITNYMLLAYANSIGLECVVKNDDCDVYYVAKDKRFDVEKNKIISFLPFFTDRVVLTVDNVKYPLERLVISQDNCSRGISNITVNNTINVQILEGQALFFYYF